MTKNTKRALSVLLTVIMIITALPPITVFAEYLFSGGSGTSSDPYLVSTPEDVLNIKNYTSKYFRQTCSISMSGCSMTPISSFTGTYDGGGFAISDVKMSTTVYTNMGLFGINYGTIKNVKLQNCNISSSVSGDFFCGGIVGRNRSGGKILDCSVSGRVSADSIYVNGEVYVGGIVGLNQGVVENCRNSAVVSAGYASAADNYAGGIVGNNNSTVKNCFNQGTITVNKGRNCLAAGIAAINFGSITGVENTGDIYANSTVVYDGYSSDSYAGGVVAYNNNYLAYAENSGFIKADSSADNSEAGGIVAYNGDKPYEPGPYIVEKCKNTGDVTAHSTAGESRAGGIAATSYMNSYIRYCCNTGNVSATENKQYNLCMAGGIVGSLMYATMIQSCNHGDVTVSATQYDAQVCGLATTTEAVIKDCYTTGNVYVNSSVVRYSNGRGATLFIDSDTTCLNCYNTGSISKKYSGNETRGLYGLSGGTDRNTVQNCFTTTYEGTTTAQRMTAEQSKLQATYTGYDFSGIWAIDASVNEGRPYLRNVPNDDANGWYVESIVKVTGISLSRNYATMTPGQMIRLYATVSPKNATEQRVTWSSSNTSIATVDANGVVTAVRNGTAIIYARTVDGGYRASCTVSVPTKSVTFSGGTGTQTDPYLVATPQDVANMLYSLSSHFRQTANISMQGAAFIPIGSEQSPFSGSFDGNGYSISDLTIESTDERKYVALFGCSTGTISNVKIKNFSISNTSTFGNAYCAALVAFNKGTVKDCHLNANVSAKTLAEGAFAFAGGLSATSPSFSFKNCSFSGEVYSKVTDIDSYAYSGGIAASGLGADNCQNYGTIRAEGAASCDVFAGGIIGSSSGSIYRCYNKGYIEATNSRGSLAGGITGQNKGTIYYSTNEGEIYSSTAFNDSNDSVYAYSGGISASNYSTVRYGYNKGTIHSSSTSSHAYAGGVVGYNQASSYIYYSKNIGEVKAGSTGGESRAGGIASSSHKDSKIMYCCNSGSVSIYNNPYYWLGLAGGVVAVLQYGTIDQCCNHGTVTIDSRNYYPIGGGICSFTDSTVTNCYSDGNVHSNFARHETYNPGMLCGIGEGCGSNVTNCYFAGELTSKYSYTEKYGLAWTNGRGGNTFTGCYTLNLYSGTEYSGRMTDAASKLQSTYAGYDFSSVWAIDANKNNGRPYLRNIPSDTSSNWYKGITAQPSLDGHTESDWIVRTQATCTTDGERYIKCTECGMEIETEIIPATGHSYSEWTVTKQPTEESTGEKQRTCSSCGDVQTEVLAKLEHVHDFTLVITEPTCTAPGVETYTCACGEVMVLEYAAALGHDLSGWVIVKDATCTENGVGHMTCSRCDYYEESPIEAYGHFYWPENTVTPTCTEKGYTMYLCLCGDSYFDDYVDALGHTMGAWTQTKAPACTEKGSERRDCSRCDHFEERDVEANGHSYSSVTTPPTCTEQGYTTHICASCDDSYVDTYVNALGHNMGAWTQTKAPACTEKGSERRDCTRCDHFEERDVEANGHSYSSVTTPPTCTEQGYTTHICASCGDSYVDTYVNALGHDFGSWTEVKAPTCDAEGQDKRICSVCETVQYRDTRISGDSNKIMVSDPMAADSFDGKVLMAIGDSLTNGTGVTKEQRYHYLVAQELGMTNINSGTSGAVLCPGGHLPNKFEALMTAELLKDRNVDVVTIFLGVNDWDNGVIDGMYQGKLKYDPSATYYGLGEFGTDDTTTIYGAAKMWCERIKQIQAVEGCEHIQFVFATPVITSYNKSVTGAKDWNQDKVNVFGYTLRQYCTAIMEVCAYYEVPVLDLNMYSGMYYHNEQDNNVDHFGGDGIHPGVNGHAMMADAFIEFLLDNYTYEQRAVVDCGHAYEKTVVEPTCTEIGYTEYCCPECHYSYVDNEVKAAGHSYASVVTPPTCTEQGYTTHTCASCGDSYVDSYTDKTEHNYTSVITPPTYTEQGYTTYTCTVCGDSYKDNFVDRLPYIPGDLDGNEKVDTNDAIYLLMYTFFPNDYPVNQPCDFDKNGRIDTNDAIYLLMHTFFPADYPII